MTKYNSYARRLDEAFRAARQEYVEAWDKFQAAKDAKSMSGGDLLQRQRAKLNYQEAERAFKEAETRIWTEFNRQRAELREKLESEVRGAALADPDTVDTNGLELLKSGILSADDYYALAEKYDDNPTMLRLVAKYAKNAANDMQGKDRGAMLQLASVCGNGQGKTMRAWDELSHVADYCSGQSRDRRDTPTHTISMGKWWEQLGSEILENF